MVHIRLYCRTVGQQRTVNSKGNGIEHLRHNLRYCCIDCLGALRKPVEASGRIVNPRPRLKFLTNNQSAKYSCNYEFPI